MASMDKSSLFISHNRQRDRLGRVLLPLRGDVLGYEPTNAIDLVGRESCGCHPVSDLRSYRIVACFHFQFAYHFIKIQ
jgi:hypothetical protein